MAVSDEFKEGMERVQQSIMEEVEEFHGELIEERLNQMRAQGHPQEAIDYARRYLRKATNG